MAGSHSPQRICLAVKPEKVQEGSEPFVFGMRVAVVEALERDEVAGGFKPARLGVLAAPIAVVEGKAPPQDSREPKSPVHVYFVLALRRCSRSCSRCRPASRSSVVAQPS